MLTPDGKELRRISLLTAFERSDYAAVLAHMASEGDILHANSVVILDGRLADRSPAFRAGNLLVSFRSLDVVAVLDPQAEKIVWALLGPWRAQHSPRILENGRMLLFDNFAGMRLGFSRVLEIDPFTQVIAWRYGEREGQRIFSESNGQADRLGNGDTLIVDPMPDGRSRSRPEGETVWEYVNPYRAGEKKELQATLTQLSRLPAGLDLGWADHPPGESPREPRPGHNASLPRQSRRRAAPNGRNGAARWGTEFSQAMRAHHEKADSDGEARETGEARSGPRVGPRLAFRRPKRGAAPRGDSIPK